MGHLKKLLFLTTALTFWSSSVSAQTPNTPENGEPGQVIGFTDQTYSINDGFYQGGNGGITISQINSNTVLNFNGTDNAGKIWDFASYLEGELGEGETVDPIKVDGTKVTPSYVEGGYFGNLTIDNGTFNDSATNGIQIYKGFSADTVVVSKDGKGTPQSFVSSGDLIINYGTFNFADKNGEILMLKNGTGSIYVRNGIFNVSSSVTATIGSAERNQALTISGGQYNIASGGTLLFKGSSISFEQGAYTPFTFSGKGTISFLGEDTSSPTITISSGINWETGTLDLAGGAMSLAASSTVNSFTFGSGSGTLDIQSGSTLTVKEDFKMSNGTKLTGAGILDLTDGAGATFFELDFGTIKVHGGNAIFSGNTLLTGLEANGGSITINSSVNAESVSLTNGASMNIYAALHVNSLLFSGSTITFSSDDASLTLAEDASIKNTSKFVVNSSEGKLYAAGSLMTFDDEAGYESTRLSSSKLSVEAQTGAQIDFNTSQGVDLNNLTVIRSAVNFNAGNSDFNAVYLGNASEAIGTLNIAEGASLNADNLTTYFGSQLNVNGTLQVGTGTINGTSSVWSKLSGTGTLRVTNELTFNGQFDNFGTVVLDGSQNAVTVEYAGLTSQNRTDTIGTLIFTGNNKTTLEIGSSVLTVNILKFENNNLGNIDIQEGGTLALDAKGGMAGDVISGSGGISGKGTLELLNNTSISFSGGSSGNFQWLGGLKIGTGTATITGDSVTRLGSIEFSSTKGGILQIDAGATLQLSDQSDGCEDVTCNIITNAGNIVQGEGTLNLISGNGSVFGGLVNLGALNFGAKDGTITFNYAGESQIDKFTINGSGANVVINNGILAVGDVFGKNDTAVYGTGTLFLKTDGTFKNSDSQSLANLKIGSGTVNIYGATIGNVSFNSDDAGTLNLSDTTTVTGNITVGAGNSIGGTKLILSGTGASGSFASDLKGLTNLTVQNGATAYIINTSTGVGKNKDGLILADNAQLVIGTGAALKVSSNTLGSTVSSVITGDGTLELAGNVTVNGFLNNLNNLSSASGTSTTMLASTLKGTISVTNGATLNFAGGSANQADIAGTLHLTADTVLSSVVFDENGGTLQIGEDSDSPAGSPVLTITNNITVNENNRLTGTGTLLLSGNSSGIFAMRDAFDGLIRIGTGTAHIQTDAEIGAIDFASGNGGVLDIADATTLTVGSIKTNGTNQITGNGTLNLAGTGSEFNAPISYLGTLRVSGGDAKFANDISIGTLAFNQGGYIEIAPGKTINVTHITQSGSEIGAVFGEGFLIAGSGNVELSTSIPEGTRRLAGVTIGTGVLDFVGDSQIGSLKYSSVEGTINISDGVTVAVESDFSGIGKLTGAQNSRLQLEGQAGATFENAQRFQGVISAGNGSLRFLSETDFTSLILNSASAVFERQAEIDEVLIADGRAEFNQAATINSLTISNAGSVYFNDTADMGALHIGAGTAAFGNDASLANGDVSAGGTLDIDVNTLTFNTGDFTFNDNSNFVMRISREATDELGNVNNTGYGRLILNGGTLNINNNVKLDLTIDYGVQTAEEGSVFQLVEGKVVRDFNFENNRYSLTPVTCTNGSGLCYRLVQTSTGGQVAEEEKGNQNQIGTAEAFLDGELFEYGTKIFDVAEHLDALSQRTGRSGAYLNALTALAPDITGAMTRQPIALQAKISNTLSSRMNGLMGSMGSSSRTYREIQRMYGRSGGSPYRSRFMRAQDYYRRAGYYDQDDRPVPRPRPAYRRRVDPRSPEAAEVTTERRRWAKRETNYTQPKEFGMWAQTFYNTADYLSADEPDGFSGDTNGFAFGADALLFDVFAVGIGYASTTTSLDTLQRETDVTGDSFFLYGMYKPADWFVSTVLNMTSLTYEEDKDLSGMMLSDSYDGSSFGASVMFGKDLEKWTPAVGLRYVTADRDAHQDEIGQDISSISTNVLTFVAETRFNYDFAQKNNSLWHSEFSGALTYDLTSSSEDAVVNLPNGSVYTVKGDDFDPLGVELGASVAYLLGEHVDISAGYNLEWRPDYTSHTLTAVFRYSF